MINTNTSGHRPKYFWSQIKIITRRFNKLIIATWTHPDTEGEGGFGLQLPTSPPGTVLQSCESHPTQRGMVSDSSQRGPPGCLPASEAPVEGRDEGRRRLLSTPKILSLKPFSRGHFNKRALSPKPLPHFHSLEVPSSPRI